MPAGLLQAGGTDDRVEQGRVGQRQQVDGRAAGQAGGQRVSLVDRVDRGAQPGLPGVVDGRVHPPLVHHPDVRGWCGRLVQQAEPAQLLLLDGAAAGDLDQYVAGGPQIRQRRPPAGGLAPPAQRRRIRVQHLRSAEDPSAAGMPQHQTITQDQRKPPIEGEPGVLVVERPHPRGDGGGAHVHGEMLRRVGERHAGGPAHVQQRR